MGEKINFKQLSGDQVRIRIRLYQIGAVISGFLLFAGIVGILDSPGSIDVDQITLILPIILWFSYSIYKIKKLCNILPDIIAEEEKIKLEKEEKLNENIKVWNELLEDLKMKDSHNLLLSKESCEFLKVLSIDSRERYIIDSDSTWIKAQFSENSLFIIQALEKMINFDTVEKKVIDNMKPLVIKFSDIIHYRVMGNLRYEMEITGGGGGGSSLAGAAVGAAVAGGVGAIIGSRKKTESIKSKTVKKDERYIQFVFNEKNQKRILIFDISNLDFFEEYLLEKEYDVLKNRRLANNSDITEKIRKLADLKEQGILTDEEFTFKKQELLSKM